MKPRKTGWYRMLWNEYASTIPFTWHRTHKGAESIPKAYRYRGSVASDYYHHMVEGSSGLEDYAKGCGMKVDWEAERLKPWCESCDHPPKECNCLGPKGK